MKTCRYALVLVVHTPQCQALVGTSGGDLLLRHPRPSWLAGCSGLICYTCLRKPSAVIMFDKDAVTFADVCPSMSGRPDQPCARKSSAPRTYRHIWEHLGAMLLLSVLHVFSQHCAVCILQCCRAVCGCMFPLSPGYAEG